jgi:hypothetical protein
MGGKRRGGLRHRFFMGLLRFPGVRKEPATPILTAGGPVLECRSPGRPVSAVVTASDWSESRGFLHAEYTSASLS